MVSSATAPRRAALDILSQVRRGEIVDRAVGRVVDGLDARDLAWLHELVYGTLRLRGRIDHILRAFVRAGLESLDAVVLDVLRLGTYQLMEMGSVPAYAAVSQSVELVREARASRAAGLVNGVLQAVNRDWGSVEFPDFGAAPVEYLATWGSHPRWLVERWVDRWGPGAARALVDANNRRPELYLTPAGATAAEAVGRLETAGIGAEEVVGFPDSVRIRPPHGPMEVLTAVAGVIQDPAAAVVARFAEFPAASVVLDISSAPGGKTVGVAMRADYVVASDLSLGRMRRVRDNVERCGVADRVGLVVADGRAPPFRAADGVLLDVPCTGTGTLRRHPDGRWRITEKDLEALAALQRELLRAAATLVRPGGTLVYATCSLEPEENEMQVERFVESHPSFRLEAPGTPFDGTILRGKYLSLLPHETGFDGAFAARLVRIE